MADDWEGLEDIDAETFLRTGGAGLRQSPVQRVRITNIQRDQIRALGQSPYLDAVTHLDVSGNKMDYQQIHWLLESEHLAKVTHLDVSGNEVGNFGLMALMSNPNIRNVRDLRLNNARLGWTDLDWLTDQRPDVARQLTHLELKGPPVGDEFGEAETTAKYTAKALLRSNYFRPEMTIAVDGFEGPFADFRAWALPKRRGCVASSRINPTGTEPEEGRS